MNVFSGILSTSMLLALLVGPSAEAQSMAKVSGEHFEIFSTGSLDDAQQAVAALEEAHAYFSSIDLIRNDGSSPLLIVAFHSSEEYAAFRLHPNAFGHFFKGPSRSFIVLTDLRPEHREALLHEYTHSVVRQAGFTLPQWLNEGIADLYSSLSVSASHATVGLPLAGRLRDIDAQSIVPLSRLLASGTLAANGANASTLYAESWALTHMLRFHPAYAGGFNRLLRSARKDMDTAAAFQQIYGKDLTQVESDLVSYTKTLPDRHGMDVVVGVEPRQTRSEAVSAACADDVLSGLLSEQPWTRSAYHRPSE